MAELGFSLDLAAYTTTPHTRSCTFNRFEASCSGRGIYSRLLGAGRSQSFRRSYMRNSEHSAVSISLASFLPPVAIRRFALYCAMLASFRIRDLPPSSSPLRLTLLDSSRAVTAGVGLPTGVKGSFETPS